MATLSFERGAQTQGKQAQAPGVVTYERSVEGIQRQFQDFLEIIRSNDQNAVGAFLDSFAIPEPERWFSQNFDLSHSGALTAKYVGAFAGIRSHIWWATGNFAKYPDFSYRVEKSELPKPLAPIGFEGLLPHPSNEISIENYRISSASASSSHGPPSWVSSFVYVEGRFRWIGGTYPFWVEGLTALRGPMALPAKIVNGRPVQAIAFRNDSTGSGIEAIVQLKVRVERDGHISKMKVLSGYDKDVDEAKQYLDTLRFPALPNDPRLANGERVWNLEVAFFTP